MWELSVILKQLSKYRFEYSKTLAIETRISPAMMSQFIILYFNSFCITEIQISNQFSILKTNQEAIEKLK